MRERPIHLIKRDLEKRMHITGSRLDEICDKIEEWRNGDKRNYRNRIRDEQRKYESKKINLIIKELNALEEKYWNKILALSPSKNDKIHKLMRFLQVSDSNAPTASKITNCLIVHQNPRITMDLFFEIIDTNVTFVSKFNIDRNELILKEIGFPSENTPILNIQKITECIYNFSNHVLKQHL